MTTVFDDTAGYVVVGDYADLFYGFGWVPIPWVFLQLPLKHTWQPPPNMKDLLFFLVDLIFFRMREYVCGPDMKIKLEDMCLITIKKDIRVFFVQIK